MAVNGFIEQTGRAIARDSRGNAIARVLITIAVIAIVTTVAIPISRDHLDSAHVARAIADLGAIDLAIGKFQAQNRGEFPGRLADMSLAVQQWQDPWGNAYQYVNLETDVDGDSVRRDYDDAAVNRDYDLYSMGGDGQSAPARLKVKIASQLTFRAPSIIGIPYDLSFHAL